MSAAIAVENVSKSYGSKKALNNLSFEVSEGSTFGFLGPNGAGKTTTIRCLMNFIAIDSGSIRLLGQKVELNNYKLRAEVGYLPADNNLYEHWKVQEHLEFMAAMRKTKVDSGLARKLDLDTKAKVSSLSTGNHQKLMIALAFTGTPKLLIMDEPTRGLDPFLQDLLYGLLAEHRDNGGTVFMSSHNLSEVERVCDAIAVIKDGRMIVEETLDSLKKKSVHEVNIIFKDKVSDLLFHSLNIEVVAHSDRSWQLKVRGDLNPLLKLLDAHGVNDLSIEHATLEELFVEMYQ